MHKEAVEKQACSDMVDVGAQLSAQLRSEHQVMLLKLLSSVHYITQGVIPGLEGPTFDNSIINQV